MKHTFALLAVLLLSPMTGICLGAQPSQAAAPSGKVPLIDVTDLYHPHQDVGDNFPRAVHLCRFLASISRHAWRLLCVAV